MKIRILFTKNIETNHIKKYLNEDKFEIFFLSVIKIKFNDNAEFEIKKHKNFILTSKNAIEFVKNKDFPDDSIFYTVGEKSCKELEKLGYSVNIVSKNAIELFNEIKKIEPCNLLHLCSSKVLPTLEENFSKTNFNYEKLEVYKTECIFPKWDNYINALVFFSPSGVESFIKNNKITNEKLFAIGNTTAKEIRKFTNKEIIISKNENTEDILRTIIEYYR